MVAGLIRTEAQSHAPIGTGNKSTFLASPEGSIARTKSHRTGNESTCPFIDCTQYLSRLLVAVPVSLVPRLSRHAVLRLMRPAHDLKMMRSMARTYVYT